MEESIKRSTRIPLKNRRYFGSEFVTPKPRCSKPKLKPSSPSKKEIPKVFPKTPEKRVENAMSPVVMKRKKKRRIFGFAPRLSTIKEETFTFAKTPVRVKGPTLQVQGPTRKSTRPRIPSWKIREGNSR